MLEFIETSVCTFPRYVRGHVLLLFKGIRASTCYFQVRSVNLDSWTAEQVQSMRVMGNEKARKVRLVRLRVSVRSTLMQF